MPTTVTCPECQARMDLASPLAPGKKVRCRRCQEVFEVPGDEGEEGFVARRAPVPRRDPRSGEGEEEDFRPRRRQLRGSRKRSSNAALIWGLVGGGVLLLAGGVVALVLVLNRDRDSPAQKSSAQEKESSKGADWRPEAAMLDRLAPETTVEGYRVRPPKGYTLKVMQKVTSKGYGWAGPRGAGGTHSQFLISVASPLPAEYANLTLEQMLDRMMKAVELRNAQGWTRTPTERGQINGLPFVRTYWSGFSSTLGRKMHGFWYLTRDGQTLVMLMSQDAEPGHEEPLKLAEAAALTFKKAS
jgi:predicted Zn finger-like uncharacterized protein